MKRVVGEAPGSAILPRAAARDRLFLAAVLVLSCLPYLGGLGLYSDDWAFLSEMQNARGSLRGMYDVLMPMGLTTRPMQAVELVALYSLFGLEPLGYHVVNTAVLALAVALFYQSLRLLGLPRAIAIVVPLTFALLPHYSTDRFWIAAFQANLSICLYFVSLYTDLRFVSSAGSRRWLWKALGVLALLGSVLAYEVTGVLLLVNVVVLWIHARLRRGPEARGPALATTLALASNVVFLALAVAYKFTTTERTTVSGGYLPRAARIVREAVPVHFGEYGLALPLRVRDVLRDYPNAMVLVVSVVVGLVVLVYLIRAFRGASGSFPGHRTWLAVIIAGGVLFVAGYGVALMTYEVGFHVTGTNNRTAIGAAIGVAWAFCGVLGLLSSLLRSERMRWRAFSALVALLAAAGTLLTGTVAEFWVRAADRQREVISQLREQFPSLPEDATVLLDGLCPFEGPAVVFATSWDVTGMLQLEYGQRSLRGDVIKPNTELTPDGVRTMLFDDVINVYPFGERLIAYHLPTSRAFTLASSEAARSYVAGVSVAGRPTCPPSTDGDGVPVF
jgi:hypothetical protein